MISILLLAFVLNALAPSGYMIARTQGGLPAVVVCPETHPLARAVEASRERNGMHDGMAMDHAAMGHTVVDHAAMGHASDDGTAPTATDKGHCALAGVAKLALHSPGEALLAAEMAYAVLLGLKAIRPLALRAPPHLRPPLRGPPPAI
ncbi:hypothetical protein I5L01_14445 [Erythrobacter sp. YJ-T3-07]|uniref:hypothetical protein n=1 Tax=Erythrobacter sp. YJ-T3-07 TaxID=2793063 RepID=UPI0018D35EA7|nr:hypothetical protein [Erythrobacter sp. YJ-T3-07]MBH1945424.1 hypothetical protein [Erythrobacter sp. YJ-T3-07]